MSSLTTSQFRYHYSGAVSANSPFYITRDSDYQFYETLKNHKYCCVLNARQMGKTSLLVRTKRKLQNDGHACSSIDLSGLGHYFDDFQWCFSFVSQLSRNSNVTLFKAPELKQWRKSSSFESPIEIIKVFVEEILLDKIDQDIVIFIDEVDYLMTRTSLGVNFISLLQFFYNQRNVDSRYERLTFALIGVVNPSHFNQGKRGEIFNIGTNIDLQGFSFEEALPLIEGFRDKADNPCKVLKEILSWTGGQPLLTQKSCSLIEDFEGYVYEGEEKTVVREKIKTYILDDGRYTDNLVHFIGIKGVLSTDSSDYYNNLSLYHEILVKEEVEVDDFREYRELLLSGLIKKKGKKLSISNRIYKEFFNLQWVDTQFENKRLIIKEDWMKLRLKLRKLKLQEMTTQGIY